MMRQLQQMQTEPALAEAARGLLDIIEALSSPAEVTGHDGAGVTCVDLVNARLAVLSGRPALLSADASQHVHAGSGRPALVFWIAHNTAAQFVSAYHDIDARPR